MYQHIIIITINIANLS